MIFTDTQRSADPASEAGRGNTLFNAVLWGTKVGFWDLDVNRDRIHWWNDWCASLNLDPCEGPHHVQRWDDHIHPQDIVGTRSYTALIKGQANFYEAEYRLRALCGSWRWVLSRGRAIETDAQGRPSRVVGVTIDIDQRKRAELALRESEARVELAVWGGDLGVWDWDMVHDRVEWLNNWCATIGLDDASGPEHRARWNVAIHPDDRAHIDAVDRACRTGSQSAYEYEYRCCKKNGDWLWLAERGRVVGRTPDGGAARITGVCMNITARKQQERALAENQERYQAVVQKVPGMSSNCGHRRMVSPPSHGRARA